MTMCGRLPEKRGRATDGWTRITRPGATERLPPLFVALTEIRRVWLHWPSASSDTH